MSPDIVGSFVRMLSWLWLGSLFTYTGSIKLLESREHNLRAIKGYRILPDAVAMLVAAGLPWFELSTGLLILVAADSPIGASAAVAAGSVFALSSATVLLRSIDTSCGCAGRASDRVGKGTLVRALAIALAGLVALALPVSWPPSIGTIAFAVALAPAARVYWSARRLTAVQSSARQTL